jgi:tripartite-type tricarboxylate transporter receptor subunit TctC
MVDTSRRQALGFIAALGAFGALPAAAQTTPFPSRPIRLIVPQAPGGNADTFGRILALKLSERINQQVVVENRAGAGGTLGSAIVAKSAPDGYTLLVADNGTHAIAPTLYGTKLPYDVFKDFTPIMLAATFPTVIVIHPSVPAANAKEFVALAKSQPGKFTYSSAGTGNGSHLVMEMFRAASGGLEMVHVPYKGGAPAIQALLAGEVQLTAVSGNTALPHIHSGRCGRSAWLHRSAHRRCPTCRPSSRTASCSRAAAGWPSWVRPAFPMMWQPSSTRRSPLPCASPRRRNAWPRSAWPWWPRRKAGSPACCSATCPSGARRSRTPALFPTDAMSMGVAGSAGRRIDDRRLESTVSCSSRPRAPAPSEVEGSSSRMIQRIHMRV